MKFLTVDSRPFDPLTSCPNSACTASLLSCRRMPFFDVRTESRTQRRNRFLVVRESAEGKKAVPLKAWGRGCPRSEPGNPQTAFFKRPRRLFSWNRRQTSVRIDDGKGTSCLSAAGTVWGHKKRGGANRPLAKNRPLTLPVKNLVQFLVGHVKGDVVRREGFLFEIIRQAVSLAREPGPQIEVPLHAKNLFPQGGHVVCGHV